MKQRKALSALLAAALMCGMLCVPSLAAEAAPEAVPAEATEAAPAEAAPAEAAPVTYTVKQGDTLGKITANFYGTNAQRYALQKANAEAFKATKGKLVPGMVLVIPDKLGKDTRIASPVAGEGETLYEIKYGDTLGKIAKATYGVMSDYKLIYERNKDRLKSASMIYEGQVIVLPVKPAPAEPAEPAEPAPAPAEPAEPEAPAEPAVTTMQVSNSKGGLNIRTGPGTNYKLAAPSMKNGTVFQIVETQGQWGKLADGRGWVYLPGAKTTTAAAPAAPAQPEAPSAPANPNPNLNWDET